MACNSDCNSKEQSRHYQSSDLPPTTYKFSDVQIQLTRHAGVIKGSTAKNILIEGNGSAIIELNNDKKTFSYSSQELITLINSLYKIRFFDLPRQYNISYSVFLNDEGELKTNALKMADSSNTTICFSLPTYKKCVNYGKDKPYDLENLVQAIFNKAQQDLID